MQKPVPLLLFSGGLDSTVMLSHALKAGDVEVLYVKGHQDPYKAKLELEARKKIIQLLEKRTGNKVIRDYHVRATSYIEPYQGEDGKIVNYYNKSFAQVPDWIYGALHVADGQRHDGLYIGYLKSDVIFPELNKLVMAWNGLNGLASAYPVAVSFPYGSFTKEDMLKMIDRELYQLVWYCETPANDKACGCCRPCKTHNDALTTLKGNMSK